MRTQGLGEDDRGWGKKDVQDNSSLKHEKGMRDGGGEFETKGKRERLEGTCCIAQVNLFSVL